MKPSKEITNGILIFLGIGLYFLLITLLGLSGNAPLRTLNALFIFYGVNKTLQSNLMMGKTGFLSNAASGLGTALIGVFLSIVGLIVFTYAQGGDAYVEGLSKTFLFGGNPTVTKYAICLLFEGIASSVIITFILLLFRNSQYQTE